MTRSILLAIFDVFGICLAIFLSATITLKPTTTIFSYHTGPIFFTIIFTIFFFYIFNLYDLSGLKAFGETFLRVCAGVILSSLTTAAFFYILGHWQFPQSLFFAESFLAIILLTLVRWAFSFFIVALPMGKVLIIGAGRAGQAIAKILQAQVVGFVDDDPTKWRSDPGNFFVTGPIDNLMSILDETGVKKLILAITHNRREKLIQELLKARLKGIEIDEMVAAYERITQKVPVHHIQDRWLILERGFNLYSKDLINKSKRFCDVAVSFLGLVLLSPLFFIVAILIKLDSSGPVIFKQKRVGLNEREFYLYKFRSMYNDAEKNGAVWAQENDPRVTRVGRWLRKLRIDELPQLWNVQKGVMSLIGCRPERKEFVDKLEQIIPYYYIRHTIKPGITGWAQINYPYGANIEDAVQKLEYDLYYIKNMSLLLDTKIFLKTIGVVLFGQGAR